MSKSRKRMVLGGVFLVGAGLTLTLFGLTPTTVAGCVLAVSGVLLGAFAFSQASEKKGWEL